MIELNLSFALKNLMDRLNYDIQSISSLLNVDPKTIENYLSKHSNPTATIARKITKLIDENNDPVHDSKPLKDYMDKWDGQSFIDKMELNKDKSVLEIGVGTGHLQFVLLLYVDSSVVLIFPLKP